MDNQRVFVWAALALVLWLNYLAWQRDYAPAPVPQPPAAATEAPKHSDAMLPELPAARDEASSKSAAVAESTAPAPETEQASTIQVTTDVLSLDISTQGGTLVRADLPQYP